MVIRPDKDVLNEHAKFNKFDKYKAEQKPDVMKVAELKLGSGAHKAAILAIAKQEADQSAGIPTKSTEEILNDIKMKKGGENVTLDDLNKLR